MIALSGCASDPYGGLRHDVNTILARTRATIGMALIVDGRDTVTVQNRNIFPLMSVFKLHQAIALCHEFEQRGTSVDTMLTIRRDELNPDTWSPMLKDVSGEEFSMPVRELLRYTLTLSDNNASNLMFSRLVSVEATDSFMATLLPRESFNISVSEAEMQRDHVLSRANSSTPLSVALLLERLYNDSIVSPTNKTLICRLLGECQTGVDRISEPLADVKGIAIAHKTGSGYRDSKGRLIAHNDAARITLPDGRHYTLVVFVMDMEGDEKDASDVISRISAAVYRNLTK